MKSTLQAILFFFVVYNVYGASHLRHKRQQPTVDPEFWSQLLQQTGNTRNPLGQQFPGQQPPSFDGQQNPVLNHGQFVGFGNFQPNPNNPPIANGLTLGANGGSALLSTTPPAGSQPLQSSGSTISGGQGGLSSGRQTWGIGNVPVTTTTPSTPRNTTPSPAYLRCLGSCPSTMEYNPVCGSDALDYHNMQRLMCANRCGKIVELVRLGTCLPL